MKKLKNLFRSTMQRKFISLTEMLKTYEVVLNISPEHEGNQDLFEKQCNLKAHADKITTLYNHIKTSQRKFGYRSHFKKIFMIGTKEKNHYRDEKMQIQDIDRCEHELLRLKFILMSYLDEMTPNSYELLYQYQKLRLLLPMGPLQYYYLGLSKFQEYEITKNIDHLNRAKRYFVYAANIVKEKHWIDDQQYCYAKYLIEIREMLRRAHFRDKIKSQSKEYIAKFKSTKKPSEATAEEYENAKEIVTYLMKRRYAPAFDVMKNVNDGIEQGETPERALNDLYRYYFSANEGYIPAVAKLVFKYIAHAEQLLKLTSGEEGLKNVIKKNAVFKVSDYFFKQDNIRHDIKIWWMEGCFTHGNQELLFHLEKIKPLYEEMMKVRKEAVKKPEVERNQDEKNCMDPTRCILIEELHDIYQEYMQRADNRHRDLEKAGKEQQKPVLAEKSENDSKKARVLTIFKRAYSYISRNKTIKRMQSSMYKETEVQNHKLC